MHVLITGAAGMLGRKLTKRLMDVGVLRARPIGRIDLVDIVEGPIEGAICTAPTSASLGSPPSCSSRCPR